MCYRCDECRKSTERYQKMIKRVVYKTVKHAEGTTGVQIAKEIKLCLDCSRK